MFKLLKANLVESDEGFSVETIGGTGIRYVQGGKPLFVDSEFLMGPKFDIVLGARGIKQWDSGENIDEHQRKLIADNIVRALVFRGMKVDVRW